MYIRNQNMIAFTFLAVVIGVYIHSPGHMYGFNVVVKHHYMVRSSHRRVCCSEWAQLRVR